MTDERMLRRLCSLYRLMLLTYPAAFRREYGGEMLVAFRSRARDLARERPRWALLAFLLHIGRDWLHTTWREGTAVSLGEDRMSRPLFALRWIAALPLALLAADAAMKIVVSVGLGRTDFHHMRIVVYAALFLMAAACVAVIAWIAPSRKASAAHIAAVVVFSYGALFIAVGALNGETMPAVSGLFLLLGGAAGARVSRAVQVFGCRSAW